MRAAFLTLVGCLLGLPTTSYAAPIQWPASEGGNGHFYERIDLPYRWSLAYEAARSMIHRGANGHLVTLTTFDEHMFVNDNLWEGNPLWIGLTDNEAYGGSESINQPDPTHDGWVWVTGEVVDYVAWCCGGPNDVNGEDFVLMGGGAWNDGQDGWTYGFIVEYDTPPTPGDTNDDGVVNIDDLNNVRNHFGNGELFGPPVDGEAFPFDGIVDISDLNRVRNFFGAVSGAATPEPNSFTVGVLFACLLLLRRQFNFRFAI